MLKHGKYGRVGAACKPVIESLEGRQMLSASPLAEVSAVTVLGPEPVVRLRGFIGPVLKAELPQVSVPATATNFSVEPLSESEASLNWTDNANNESGYLVQRKAAPAASWVTVQFLPANTESCVDGGLTAGALYTYRVLAFNDAGMAYSIEAGVTMPSHTYIYTLENDPSGLTATAVSSGRINLSWTDNSSNETGFKVERKTGAGGIFVPIATVGAGVSIYSDASGLSAGTQYFYRVCAVGAGGDSGYSAEAGATTPAAVPAAASNLVATAVSSGQINLAWTDNSSNETWFKIERMTDESGTYMHIGTVGASVTSYIDSNGLLAGTLYFYRVRASNAAGNSAYSAEAFVTTVVAVPAAPTSLSATAFSSSQINLAWTDNSDNETGFKIERKTGSGGTYARIATVGADVTRYSDSGGLAAETQYYYRILATNAGGDSVYKTAASATTGSVLPTAPSGLTATAASSSQINLSWSDNSSNETGFKIERKTGAGGVYAQIAAVNAGVSSYSDSTGLAAGTQYFYRVRATNAGGDSSYSAAASATTRITAPTAPSGATAIAASASKVNLTWTDNSNNETGFNVVRSTDGTNFTTVAVVAPDYTSYTDTGLTPGTQYYYTIVATNDGGTSVPSDIVNATTAQVILPGAGWTGPTAQPAAVGQPGQTGYTATAIARWDVVPYQTFTGDFNVGVVAFDIAGIDHVGFSVNGGPWTSVSGMTLNPQVANHSGVGNPSDGVVEYWATLRASDFAQDGMVEVRAIAYPTAGVPRVLDSLNLNANARNTLTPPAVYISPAGSDTTGDGTQNNPYATMLKASMLAPIGATVYMAAGTYTPAQRMVGFRNDGGRWLTFTPAPGVSPNQVTVTINPDVTIMRAGRIAFRNVRVDMTQLKSIRAYGDQVFWLDNCKVFSTYVAPPVGWIPGSFLVGGFLTDSVISNIPYIPTLNTQIIRNVTMDHVAGGPHNPQLIVNLTMNYIESLDENHCDGLRWLADGSGNVKNIIAYNVMATDMNAQIIFVEGNGNSGGTDGATDMAIVNVTGTAFRGAAPGPHQPYGVGSPFMRGSFEHIVLDNVHLTNQRLYFADDVPGFTWSNSVIRNSSATMILSVNPATLLVNDTLTDGTVVPNR